ncbi:MAG: hypothetical protein QOI73_2146 [Solirubrobacteraceae bacterium]|nr:hypothetical protein [Solirubrobacteraceae bacterium]
MHAAPRRRSRSTAVVLSTLAAVGTAALVAGCGDDSSKDSAASATTFAVEATRSGEKPKLTFPSTVKAGLVKMTLKNSDTRAHSAGLVRLVGDHTVDEAIKITSGGEDGAPIPDWLQDGGGLETVKAGQTGTVEQVLAPGRYAITDDETKNADGEGKSNAQLGAKGEFTVTGPASKADLPDVPATVTAKEYSFQFKGLKAGTNQVRFENTGKQLHHALFFPINKGSTIADAKKAFASQQAPKGPPPVDFDNGFGTAVIDGGIAQNVTLDFAAGSYAVVCFIQDRAGGPPHVAKGMISELVVK